VYSKAAPALLLVVISITGFLSRQLLKVQTKVSIAAAATSELYTKGDLLLKRGQTSFVLSDSSITSRVVSYSAANLYLKGYGIRQGIRIILDGQ
jgi:hypothetical protein